MYEHLICGRRKVIVEYPTGKRYTKSLKPDEDLNKRISAKYINTYKIISDEICNGKLIWINDSEYDYESWYLIIKLQCLNCRTIHKQILGEDDLLDFLNEHHKNS